MNATRITTCGLLALAALAIASCAYQETMTDRRNENASLRQQLDAEQARSQNLQR